MTLNLHDPEASPPPDFFMTSAFNVMGQAQHPLREFPRPDAADLAHLAAMARRDPDRAYTPGPCIERLRFHGLVEILHDVRRGRQVVVTEAGHAAVAGLA